MCTEPWLVLQHIATMAAQQDRRVPKATFRVLIVGRANAGKTTILHRVFGLTESPEIYRVGPSGRRKRVRSRSYLMALSIPSSTQVQLESPGVTVSGGWGCLFLPATIDREDPACSVACITSRTNSSSQVTKVTFFTTPADSKLAVTTSWRLCKILCVASRGRGN